MKVTKYNKLKFSTDRELSVSNGVIGINHALDTFEGYDGELIWEEHRRGLTKEEKIELADYMIGLWTKFKKRNENVDKQ